MRYHLCEAVEQYRASRHNQRSSLVVPVPSADYLFWYVRCHELDESRLANSLFDAYGEGTWADHEG